MMSKRKMTETKLAQSSEDNLTHYLTKTVDEKEKFISIAVSTSWYQTGTLTVKSGDVGSKGIQEVKVFATLERAVEVIDQYFTFFMKFNFLKLVDRQCIAFLQRKFLLTTVYPIIYHLRHLVPVPVCKM
jgi:hypothetical protein